MHRPIQFIFRVSLDERRAIAELATCLQRSQSDAVRFVVIEAARQLAQPAPVNAMHAEVLKKKQGGTHVKD